jgi:hypothetical protein
MVNRPERLTALWRRSGETVLWLGRSGKWGLMRKKRKASVSPLPVRHRCFMRREEAIQGGPAYSQESGGLHFIAAALR